MNFLAHIYLSGDDELVDARAALAALADGERRTLERSKLPHESGETGLSAGAGLWKAVRALRGTIRLCRDGPVRRTDRPRSRQSPEYLS